MPPGAVITTYTDAASHRELGGDQFSQGEWPAKLSRVGVNLVALGAWSDLVRGKQVLVLMRNGTAESFWYAHFGSRRSSE